MILSRKRKPFPKYEISVYTVGARAHAMSKVVSLTKTLTMNELARFLDRVNSTTNTQQQKCRRKSDHRNLTSYFRVIFNEGPNVLARACGIPAVGIWAVNCWQWRIRQYNHQSFLFLPFFSRFFSCVSSSKILKITKRQTKRLTVSFV